MVQNGNAIQNLFHDHILIFIALYINAAASLNLNALDIHSLYLYTPIFIKHNRSRNIKGLQNIMVSTVSRWLFQMFDQILKNYYLLYESSSSSRFNTPENQNSISNPDNFKQ